jgi:hypothetical protein
MTVTRSLQLRSSSVRDEFDLSASTNLKAPSSILFPDEEVNKFHIKFNYSRDRVK